MSRIGSTISGMELRLLDSLAYANAQVTLSAYRMSTGHKINSPGDNPSAFVTLSGLQTQLSNVTSTLANVTSAGSMISQTQTALTSMETQLTAIRTELLKDETHTLTPSQRAESQAKIDTAIDQINSLAGTNINGKTTLAGAADFTYSGRNTGQVADVVVRAKSSATDTISGSVVSTATQAQLIYVGNASNQVTADATFTLTGMRGSQVLNVTSGEALSTVAAAVNGYSHDTGITAAVDEVAHTLTFTSVDYGSSAKANVSVSSGVFVVTGGDGAGHSTGANASAIINGRTISSSSNNVSGNRFSYSDSLMTFEIEFQPGFTGAFDSITVSGNNLSFSLSQDINTKSALTIPAVFAPNLNGPSGNLNDLYTGGSLAGLGDNTSQAIRVVDEALGKLARVQGAVDGFYNAAITSSSTLFTDMATKLGDYIDSIDQVDDEEEILKSDYYQALADNAISSLVIINQQRQSIVNILQDIAGLKQT
jgi:flagellin